MIFATNRHLKEEVEKGNFRRDLFFRINVLNVRIPSLRERQEDILIIASSFIIEFCHKNKMRVKKISEEAREVLEHHSWEGNIRELRNAIEYAVVMTEGDIIKVENLPGNITEGIDISVEEESWISGLSFREAKERFERNYFVKILKENNGNVSMTAKQSKLARQFIYRKLEGLGIELEAYRAESSSSLKK